MLNMNPWEKDQFMGAPFRRYSHKTVSLEQRRVIMLAGRGAFERADLQNCGPVAWIRREEEKSRHILDHLIDNVQNLLDLPKVNFT